MLAAPLLFMGCSKENTASTPVAPQADTEAEAVHFSTATLRFASMEELDQTIAQVAMMTPEERQAWEAAHEGFVSMNAAARTVADQMKSANGKQGVLALQKKYADLFIFDPNQEEVSAIPFFKSNRVGYAHVCNAYGDVEVAGQLVNLNDITTYAETWVGKAMTGTRNPVHRLILTNGSSHRFIAVSTYNDDLGKGKQIFIRYSSQLTFNGVWYPTDDQYTVSYEPGLTDNAGITFDTRFNYGSLTAPGTSFTNTTPYPDYLRDEFVGYGTYYNSGYRVASKWTGQNGRLIVEASNGY